MNLLILHPNFPGQFKLLAHELAGREGWHVVGMGLGEREPEEVPAHLAYHAYRHPTGPGEFVFPPVQHLGEQVRRGRTVADRLQGLRDRGFRPDVVLAHPGWGDALFVPEVFPRARLIAYLEYFYKARDCDIDFDPEFPVPQADLRFVPLRNATNLMAFAAAEASLTPTAFQAGLFPPAVRAGLTVLHEGIDTAAVAPLPEARFALPDGRVLSREDEVVTYVSRSLEPYRGFHVFMRALPELLRRRPRAQVLVVGREEVSYGRGPAGGGSWKAKLLKEVGADLDTPRVHFLGNIAYGDYRRLLGVSRVHLYLTYPFVLSWSLLEALASGCTVVGSDTAPVREVITDRVNGRLVPFFDRAALVDRVCELLDDEGERRRLGEAAREGAVAAFDFRTRTFPRYLDLLRGV